MAISPENVRSALHEIERLVGYDGLAQRLTEQILGKESFLFVDGPNFMVAAPRPDGSGGFAFVVEAAWSTTRDGFFRYQDLAEQLARECECSAIEFHTFRRGFERVAPKCGYTKSKTRSKCGQFIWRKPLWVAAPTTR